MVNIFFITLRVKIGFTLMISVIDGKVSHFLYELFIRRKDIQQKAKKEDEEYRERDDWPDCDVLYVFKNIFIHGALRLSRC